MFTTPRPMIFICVLIIACIPGCMAFSDSSAMRVEVEVYKGPLSLEPEIQLGELYGYLLEAHTGLFRTYKLALKNPSELSGMELDKLSEASLETVAQDSDNLLKRLTRSICAFIPDDDLSESCPKNTRSGGDDARPVLSNSEPPQEEETEQARKEHLKKYDRFRQNVSGIGYKRLKAVDKDVLVDITRTATAMQVAAFRYATVTTAGQPPNAFVRIAMTFFVEAVSEYGNQLEARADALLKQLGTYGHDRRELPLSTHLRDSEPTDFLHLFEWIDGHIPRGWDYLNFNFSPNVRERIKIVERLYGDHFWSKINTVYASGRGKTQMAFIKDETGNWNLKSFANDPTELLEAYTNVAKKALQKAAEIAAGAATGGGSSASLLLAKQLRDFAAETEPDKVISQTSPAGSLSLDHLRTRLADKLDPIQFNADFEKETELVEKVKGKAEDASKELGGSDKQTTAATALTDARKELAQHRQQVVARWEEIFNDHSNLVDILSTTVKKK